MPVQAHIKERGAMFHRFDVLWTPTVLVLDDSGRERYRSEGYLPRDEFAAQLRLALGRAAFMRKDWTGAEKWYDTVVREFGSTVAVPEAMYWRGVCKYKRTNDHRSLREITREFERAYTGSMWARKASVWG